MTQLNGYIIYLPCEALENQDALKEEFTKIKMREILDMALPNSYRKELFGIDWNIYEQPFLKTIDKLITVKPDIKAETAKAKSNKELADKVFGNKGTKRNNNGTTKVSNADKMPCKTCKKLHKGECWLLKNGGNAGRNNQNGGKPFDKKQMKFINTMFKSHASSKEEESDSISGSSSTVGWKKGISTVHQMYIAHQYQTDNGMDLDEDVKLIDSNQLKTLRKQARKAEKALKRS